MARDPERYETRSALGRVDPFCWVAVASMLLLAVIVTAGGVPMLGIPLGVLALLVLGFDSWVNRDEPSPARWRSPQGGWDDDRAPRAAAAPRRSDPRPRGPGRANARAGHGY
ncbi:hypothetical protein [Gandjariella thermophila]|uniref:Uncharacterized protein n=1 Tax=Gandjariella thermophila TaxID=1931992 RepID=A0A4D4JAZ5_9PSEU|nr:hypothetical protein [Gandjariella thermophila]GDY32512.1 hypothetical protein GTS_41450 [Gandjariella thermophila]